jgi:hypothetical protein
MRKTSNRNYYQFSYKGKLIRILSFYTLKDMHRLVKLQGDRLSSLQFSQALVFYTLRILNLFRNVKLIEINEQTPQQ